MIITVEPCPCGNPSHGLMVEDANNQMRVIGFLDKSTYPFGIKLITGNDLHAEACKEALLKAINDSGCPPPLAGFQMEKDEVFPMEWTTELATA